MSIFSSILDKLGIHKPAAPAQTSAPAAPPPQARSAYENLPKPAGAPAGGPPQPAAAGPKPGAMPMVDVVSKLEAMAKQKGEKSNWKVSIADLLYLLGIDNSYANRKELATELGCPQELMADSAKMNTWLHKTVLAKIAENGGNIPPELFK